LQQQTLGGRTIFLSFDAGFVRDVSRKKGLMAIHYVTGDATAPMGDGNKIVAHICNDVGAWGAGFVLAISKRWPEPQVEYLKSAHFLKLGEVSFIKVEPGVWVGNMIAQRGIRTIAGVPPIRYDALRLCLGKLALKARQLQATIHMPRIGCGLAGGKWSSVEPLIREAFLNTEVFVYDLPH
jgi:O-acetyl-ADP-ribose deacetylase (regulator of RNase III)